MTSVRPDRALVLALLMISACGDVNHGAGDYTMSNNKTATASNDEPQPLAVVVPREDRPTRPPAPVPQRPSLATSLSALPGSLLEGASTLRPAGQMSIVSVNLTGGTSQTSYEGSIRQGSCARTGSTIAELIPVTADSTGAGAAVSYAQLPTDSLLKGAHVLVYGQGGRTEACGVIADAGASPSSADSTNATPPG